MAATPLIIALTALTATILVLFILWVCIRFTKDRRTRSRSQDTDERLQLEHIAACTVANSESRVDLHCTYQPSIAPHVHAHSHGDGEELQSVMVAREEGDMDKAEVWLKRGASRDDLRGEGRGPDGLRASKMVRGWDMMGAPSGEGLEGAGRR